MYRIKDPIIGDEPAHFDAGVLDAPVATPENVLQADCVIFGAPGKQGRMCAEMAHFFDSLAAFQTNGCLLKGKVGSAFTSVGGSGTGYGGHEAILQSFHAFFLQHGMPPPACRRARSWRTRRWYLLWNVHVGETRGGETGSRLRSLSESEVKLAYSQGEWSSIITKQLHDDGD